MNRPDIESIQSRCESGEECCCRPGEYPCGICTDTPALCIYVLELETERDRLKAAAEKERKSCVDILQRVMQEYAKAEEHRPTKCKIIYFSERVAIQILNREVTS